MQSFTTKQLRHHFSVDGSPYFLPGFTIDDIEQVGKLGELTGDDQLIEFRRLLAERAQGNLWAFWRMSPRQAIHKLDVAQLADLFHAWTGTGKTLGESLALPDSQ